MKRPTVLLRMSNNCNLNCTYCYDKTKNYNGKYENTDLYNNTYKFVKYMDKIYDSENNLRKIIFHGGEPLLINAKTYKKLINELLQKNSNYKFYIQTNLTLLNSDFIELFKKYGIRVGISLDGYNEEQNNSRLYPNGRSSFYDVMKNINELRKANIKFGVIMTITKNHIGKEMELYKFIEENNLWCSIRPAFFTKKSNSNVILTWEEYATFFQNIFDIWYEDTRKIVKLNQISDIYQEFMKSLDEHYSTKMCCDSKNCFQNFISLDLNGNVYSCNRAYNNSEFYYGNLNEVSMQDIYKKIDIYTKNRVDTIEKSKCIKCKIYNYCNGGCPVNAYELHSEYIKPDDYFCKAKIQIHEYIIKRLEEENYIKYYREKKKYGNV